MKPDDINAACGGCGSMNDAWITTCPACGACAKYPSESISLAGEVAPTVSPEVTWIDIPLSADEPARVALFRHFLKERGFAFEESRRFISVHVNDADAIANAIRPWVVEDDLSEDPRVFDSLTQTMQRVGQTVIETIESHRATATSTAGSAAADRIDLR